MNIILYIGHHKVGSTALQLFLSRNACALLRAGILYPCVEMEGFSLLLARAMGKGDGTQWMSVNPREPHSALAYQMMAEVSPRPIPPQFTLLPRAVQMLHAIRQQLRYLGPHTMILCSEAFANFADVDPGLITRLRRALPEGKVQIYCALRRPDDYLTAWHGQRIKVGEAIAPLRETGISPYIGTIHTDYDKLITPWIDQFPQARLHLRSYDDICAAGGSPQDFLARTGIDLPPGLLPAEAANPSLPRAAIEIKRRANLVLPHGETEQLAHHLLTHPSPGAPIPTRQIEMFGAGHRAELAALFAPIHAALSQRLGQPAFFADMDDIARPRPVPEEDAMRAYLAGMDPAAMPSDALKTFITHLQEETACAPL